MVRTDAREQTLEAFLPLSGATQGKGRTGAAEASMVIGLSFLGERGGDHEMEVLDDEQWVL